MTRQPIAGILAGFAKRTGVRRAFGVNGGAIARFVAQAQARGLEIVHARHEAGAAFMATEDSLARQAPSLVFTTTGPGLTNAITGLAAAAWEGAQVIAVVGATRAESLGRGAFQETGPGLADALSTFGPRTHCHALREPSDLPAVLADLERQLAQAGGCVATITLPDDVAGTLRHEPDPPVESAAPTRDTEGPRVASMLRGRDVVVWVGFGARALAADVMALVERTGFRVMASPRAKGTFPEHHRQYLGVTGFGGHPEVLDALRRRPPDDVLVLGTRLGEFTSGFDPGYLPRERLVHVDTQAEAFGRAYPDANTVPITADLRTFIRDLARAMPACQPTTARVPASAVTAHYDTAKGIHPARLMEAVQASVVDRSDAIVLTEAGNAFAWGSRALRFDTPSRYRTSTHFGAMGHASAGVVGAALAHGKAVAVLGDGAALMTNEINTAVAHQAPAVWVILNDGAYGMVHHGMLAIDLEPVATTIPRVDFVAFARSQGADGVRVRHGDALPAALDLAMAHDAPFVVDVAIDRSIAPPFGNRNDRLSS